MAVPVMVWPSRSGAPRASCDVCACVCVRAQAYEFWRHDFVRSNVQISDLLQNIARYCGNAKPGESSAEGGQQAQAQQQPPQPR
jgi:hypothetical protein